MPDTLKHKVIETYQRLFHTDPALFISAPGRINLIGEHTDYSDGFVLPVAINLGINIALSPKNDQRLKLYSIDFSEWMDDDLTSFDEQVNGWKAYVKGVAWALNDAGQPLKGWEGVIAGNIPIGAGLSSSAALEIATGKAFSVVGDFDMSNKEIAQLGKKAETDWVGVKVGIMDQLISAEGKAGHAVLLDCRTMHTEYVPIPKGVSFVVLDTKTRRELTLSAYNNRHEEVKQAAGLLGVTTLRDAKLLQLEDIREKMPSPIYRRARHVLTENQRVHQFTEAMQKGALEEMGHLINASHQSLRDDFEVSSEELNLIVNLAQSQSICLGARMMGAGFGGCALALIEDTHVEKFISNVHQAYFSNTGIQPHLFKVESADGVQAVRYYI